MEPTTPNLSTTPVAEDKSTPPTAIFRTPLAEDSSSSVPTAFRGRVSLPPSLAAVKKAKRAKHSYYNSLISENLNKNKAVAIARERMRKNPHLSGPELFALCNDGAALRKLGRYNKAEEFRKEYTYGSVIDGCISKERKSCIIRGDTFSWQDESSGTIWVGVHGADDAICVVTKSEDLDETRLRGRLSTWPKDTVFYIFRKSLIAEMEDLEDSTGKVQQRFHYRIEQPFGVVSVPDTHRAASCVEKGEIKAIEFLQDKMNSDTSFTVNETIQTAISAFQHLFQKKFTADEIQVCVVDPDYKVYAHDNGNKDPSLKELNVDEIKEHLDDINKCGSTCHVCSEGLHDMKLNTS